MVELDLGSLIVKYVIEGDGWWLNVRYVKGCNVYMV